MTKYFVALHRDATVEPLIVASNLKYQQEQAVAPSGETVSLSFLYLVCSSVAATDYGLVRLELFRPKDHQSPPFSALIVPGPMIAWATELQEGHEFPPGFVR